MPERTEEEALTGLLHLTVGGQPVELPTLSIERSEAWLARYIDETSDLNMEGSEDEDSTEFMRRIVQTPTQKMLVLLAEYDHEGRLGGVEGLRSKITQRELSRAMEACLEAERPLDVDGLPSVAEAFGGAMRLYRTAMLTVEQMAVQSLSGNSMNGLSANGDLPGVTSAGNGRKSSSSSDGNTATTGSASNLVPIATRSRTASTSGTRRRK
jgi:hypothetical protein